MINRVFYYSKDVAKKYGNRGTFLKLGFGIFVIPSISLLVVGVLCKIIGKDIFPIMLMAVLIFFYFYNKKILNNIKATTSAWAMADDGHLYKVVCNKVGQGLPLLTTAVGGMIDSKNDNTENAGKVIGTVVGTAEVAYFYKRAEEYMSTPEIVAKFVEERNNDIGAIVYELLKVYSIKEYHNKIIIKCDYKISYNDKINYNKRVVLLKVYNSVENLIEIIKNYNLEEKKNDL